MNNIKRYLTQRNRNIIAIIIIILGVGYLAYYSFFSPTYINSYIASNIYKTPANSAFKDDNFYQCVVDAYNDENKTSVAYTTNLSDSQLKTITSLSCSKKEITDASGLEKMTALTYLDVSYNQLTSLDVSNNTKLTELDAYSNQLTSLDVSNNPALTKLYANSNQLTSLDVSNNPALTKLYANSNQLTSLDISNNPALTELYASSNQLTSLDVSNNTKLTKLAASSNQLISLDVSNNTKLTELYAFDNQLTSLDVSNNPALTKLLVPSNQLTSLDVSKNTDLTILNAYSNQLTSLDVSKNTDLRTLDAYSNQLTSLDVSNNTKLEYLNASSNQLTSLDVSNNTKLTKLDAYSNQLTSLDVSKNTDLTILNAYSNQLTSLDVSNNTKLTKLDAYSNQLTSLDVSNNTKLTELYAFDNQLTSLDVSNNPALKTLLAYSNQLTSLDVSNNPALTTLWVFFNQLTSLDVSNNPALTKLLAYSNQLTNLNVSGATALTYLDASSNQLTSLDVSNNPALTTLSISSNSFSSSLGTMFKGKVKVDIKKLTSIVKIPTSLTISSSTNEVSKGLSLEDNIVTATDAGEQSIVVTNKVSGSSYTETYYVNVIDLTSDVYDIDVDKDYILIDSKDKVLDNIVCSNCDASIEDNYLVIKSNKEEVKRFKLVTVISSVYDINDDYIYVGNDSDATIINNVKVMSGASIKIKDNNLVVEYDNFTVSYKLVRYSSDTYDLSKGYIYVGIKDIDLDKINVINGNKEIKDNNLVISYNDNVLETIPIVSISSEAYDLTKDYIYTGFEDIDLNNIIVINGNKEIKDNNLIISYNDNVLETIPIVRYNSEAYDLTKGYIYTGFEDIDLNNITVINGNKEIKDNNLIISYNNNELDKIPVYSLKMNNGSIRVNNEDKIIYIKEESISSSDFIDSIDFNSDKISIGIYDNDVLVEENVKVGYVIKVSIDLEDVDSYEVLYRENYVDYYNTLDVELNVNDNNDIIKNIAGSSTFDNLVKLVDTDGVITIKNSNNEELSESDIVKTGDRLEVTLTDYTHLITLSVRGDVTGRGLIDNEDVLEAYKILKNRKEVEKEYYLASDIDRDGELKISDITRLYRYTKGLESLDD